MSIKGKNLLFLALIFDEEDDVWDDEFWQDEWDDMSDQKSNNRMSKKHKERYGHTQEGKQYLHTLNRKNKQRKGRNK